MDGAALLHELNITGVREAEQVDPGEDEELYGPEE